MRRGSAIEDIARERGAPIVPAWDGRHRRSASSRRQASRPGFACARRRAITARSRSRCEAHHQIGNAVVAVRILEQLDGIGIDVPPAAIVDGLAQVSWPGRLEHRRLPDGREMILDAAHNPAGAATLAAYLAETFAEKPPLVFAAMLDKDVARHVRGAAAGGLGAGRDASVDRAIGRSGNAGARRRRPIAPDLPVRVEPIRADALAAAWADSPRIVVAGSIFLLGDVLRETASVVITFETSLTVS